MNRRNAVMFSFAIFLAAIPALVHALFGASHGLDATGFAKVFWRQYPISMTIPYVFLALMFVAHCGLLMSKSRRSAYCGAVAAWLGMMGFSIALILHAPVRIGSTGGPLAIALTPLFYIPYLVFPYAIGATVGVLWNKWKKWKDDKSVREA